MTLVCLLGPSRVAAGEWSTLLGGDPTITYEDVFFFDKTHGWLVGWDAGVGSGFVLFNGSGLPNDWQDQTPSGGVPGLRRVHFISATEGWAVGDDFTVLHYTEAGGWVSLYSDVPSMRAVFFWDSQTGWVGSDVDGSFHKTTNGGNGWSEFDVPGNIQDIAFVSESVGWAAVDSFALSYVYETNDGGVSWYIPIVSIPNFMYGLEVEDESSVWAVGANGDIYLGTAPFPFGNWEEYDTTTAEDAELHDIDFAQGDPGFGWAVGLNSTIVHKVDGGTNWFKDTVLEPGIDLLAVSTVDRSFAWAVGNEAASGGYLLKFSCVDVADCIGSNLCDIDEQCTSGECTWATDTCFDGNECTDDLCDPAAGCSNPANANPCDDGDPCTHTDTCAGGACSGTAYVCDDGNPCTDDSCNGDSTCTFTDNSAACDDGDACTHTDTCSAGACSGTAYVCDDANPCTDDSCNGDATCTFVDNSAACDDGDACTHTDTCSAGACSGTAYVCDDANPCTDDSCNGDSTCTFGDNSVLCDDGDACTHTDTCAGGTCAGTAYSCDDGNPCTDDICNGDDTCSYLDNGIPCDDGDPCTHTDTCAGGICGGTAYSCDDDNPCTDDSCNGDDTCTRVDNSNPCDDGDPCTHTDACAGGLCAGTSYSCDDENPCTDDICNGDSTCSYSDNSLPCDDGDPCTHTDTCTGSVCSGTEYSCDDENDCTVDSCNGDDTCSHTNVENGTECEDGNDCTEKGSCQEGICISAPPKPDGTECDDDYYCTVGDTCHAGECIGGPDRECPETDDPCTYLRCDEVLDTCVQDSAPICSECQECEPGTGNCLVREDSEGADCEDENGCRGVCDGEGVCLVEAYCGSGIAGCENVTVEYGEGVDCRLPEGAVELRGLFVGVRTDSEGFVPVRIDISSDEWPLTDLFVRLDLESAVYVLDSAAMLSAGPSLEELPYEELYEVLFHITDEGEGLPVGEEGWALEILFEMQGHDLVYGVDAWAPCAAPHEEPGCHFGFALPREDRQGGVDAPDLQFIGSMDDEDREPVEIEEFENLVLGCSCGRQGGGDTVLVLLILVTWGLRRRSTT